MTILLFDKVSGLRFGICDTGCLYLGSCDRWGYTCADTSANRAQMEREFRLYVGRSDYML